MIVADANVAVAILNPNDRFHRAAVERCQREDVVAMLNATIAEALIHPTRAGQADAARAILTDCSIQSRVVSDDVADLACQLRATHGNRNFPMVDALVVGLGIALDTPILTADAKWPTMPEATIERLAPAPPSD